MLCRILTELKLLDTPVGVIVLSAGVGNDVVGRLTPRCLCSLANTANQDGSCLRSVSLLLTLVLALPRFTFC